MATLLDYLYELYAYPTKDTPLPKTRFGFLTLANSDYLHRIFLDKLTFANLVKNFPHFYGTRGLIAVFQKSPPLDSIQSYIDIFHTLISKNTF